MNELRKAIPHVMELLNNETFMNYLNNLGYQVDKKALLKLFADAAGFRGVINISVKED